MEKTTKEITNKRELPLPEAIMLLNKLIDDYFDTNWLGDELKQSVGYLARALYNEEFVIVCRNWED